MNLRVAHLLRKTERIDRDLEELDSLLNSLQMDREYSVRLKDSLVDESFRLRQLKQKINGQVIRIPTQMETFLQETIIRKPELTQLTNAQVKKLETEARSKPEIADSASAPISIEIASAPKKEAEKEAQKEPAKQSAISASKNQTKKPPFLFRFE